MVVYPTAEQTEQMMNLLNSPYLPGFTKSQTLYLWRNYTPEQAAERIKLLVSVIHEHANAGHVPEASTR